MGWEISEELKQKAKIQQVVDTLDGWRYLKVGEMTEAGDYLCDPRCKPVRIVTGGIVVTKGHHPVKRWEKNRKSG